jgi:hypothetical protein
LNVTVPPALAERPVKLATSLTDVPGSVSSVASATVEMFGLALVTTEVSPSSPHWPLTGLLLASPE